MKLNKKYIKKLKTHIENTKSNIKYSLDRFDILIISLASGGIVVAMGFMKDIYKTGQITSQVIGILGLILFISAIFANLASQITSYYANKLEVKNTNNQIRQKKGKEPKGNVVKLERIEKFINYATIGLNYMSLTFLVAAAVLTIIFINNNLKI